MTKCQKVVVKKRGIILLKMHLELSPVIVQVTFLIVNLYSEFQVNMFSNGRDITKLHSFCVSMMTTRQTPRL